MFGFVVGTFCLVGLFGLAKGSFMHGHRGRHCGSGPRSRGRRGGLRRGGFARAAGEVFKRRLGIDADQEGIVDHAVADLQATLRELGTSLRDSRTEIADAFLGDTVDDGALAAVFSRHDEEIGRARHDVISALKQIHAVLDPEQRADAAEWLGTDRPGWV